MLQLGMAPVCSCADQHHMGADCMLATDLDQGYQLLRAALTDNGDSP